LNQFVGYIYSILHHLGGFGLLILGVLDSSFLFMPLGNDLLMVAMTASRHVMLPYYAGMATAGSVLGCLITDILGRKGGEAGLEKKLPRKRIEYIKRKVTQRAGWALALASLMPPPFPFTPFVVAAAALQYPRKKLLAVIAVGRFIRFCLEGLLAISFGAGILRLAKSPMLQYVVIGLVIVSIVGTTLSLYKWIKKSKKAAVKASPDYIQP
jgi:membrane protein YqaA with SNARE-associated domain